MSTSLQVRGPKGPGPAPTRRDGPGRDPLAPLKEWWRTLPEEQRRKLVFAGLVVAYVLLLGVGGYWNFSLHLARQDVLAQIARHEVELSRAPLIRSQLHEETLEQARLRAERDRLYSKVPDIAAVPAIVGRLEEVARAVGGEITDVYYREPVWQSDEHGIVGIDIVFEGDFYTIENYFASVLNSWPSLRWNNVEIEPVDKYGNNLRMQAHATMDIMERRRTEVAAWSDDQPILFAVPTRINPFAVARRVGTPVPAVYLHGVVHQNGQSLALLSVDGVSHVVAEGQRVGDMVVTHISSRSVVMRSGDRTVHVDLTE